jgi:dTDP-4-amino-4,6-dideoxygalactose transaminase
VTARFSNMPHLPVTERIVGRILSLPIHGEMELAHARIVCEAIREFRGNK